MSEYKGKINDLLKSISASVGDKIRVNKEDQTFEGLLMPRTERGVPGHIVLKLDSGYNIGIEVTDNTEIEKLKEGKEPELGKTSQEIEPNPEKPDVTIIGTGGTVASRIDYRTGAVHPEFSASEIYSSAPEIAEIANINTTTACNVLSENMTPKLWTEIANTVAEELNEGADGAVIAHGTDTMGYTASALSFILKNLTKPVVLVGSQRSSDRPSSDAALNLVGAISAATSDLAEVCVTMHGSIEDEFSLIHRGTKVRKCHTSRRDAFQSVNVAPLGKVTNSGVEFFQSRKRREKGGKVEVESGFEERVALVKISPNVQADIIEGLLDKNYRGLILEGTGLGHVPKSLYSGIENAIEQGVPVAMTSQCIWGRTNMRVYSTGRDLLDLGVFPLENMLPETAYVKMMWVLDKTQDMEEVKRLMRKNIAREIAPRSEAGIFLKPNLPEDKK